jgi:hypothetical protein
MTMVALGVKALLTWTVVAKRSIKGGGSGYEEALSVIREPVISRNGSDTVAIIGAMVQQVHLDTLEKLVLGLWRDENFGMREAQVPESRKNFL